MHSRLLPLLVVSILSSGGLVFLNKEFKINNSINQMEESFLYRQDKFGKKYATAEEITYRFSVFKEYFNYIQE